MTRVTLGALAVTAVMSIVASLVEAQTVASPRGANGEGLGLEGTWDGATFLELAYTRRLRTPLFGRPGGWRVSLGWTFPTGTVRASAGLASVAASAGALVLIVAGAVVGAVTATEREHGASFGLALGMQAGWMADRAYVTAFASLRPTVVSMRAVDDQDARWRGMSAARVVIGVQAGVALARELVLFVAAGAHHAIGGGEVGPVVFGGVRVHP